MPRQVVLLDAGLGNLGSVERALAQVGAAVVRTSDPDVVARARSLVFPGQGAFGDRTDSIVGGPLGDAIRASIAGGGVFLGICLGMQLLFEGSDEAGGRRGLGLLRGRARRFPDTMAESLPGTEGRAGRRLKIPHMGWNDVAPEGEHYYFVHSYYVDGADPDDVRWTCTYGDVTFPAAVVRGNVVGCQFHPEKSQRAGLRFLRSFLLGGWK